MANAAARPHISVIIPARNEEASLPACLESLVAQQGTEFEIIVVDDGSSDRTAEIARSFAHVRVMAAPPLPPGWAGKPHACWIGAQQARGAWLLFTDADTVHLPGSLARALAEAREQGAALLSYSPAQETRSFWERAVLPLVFAELARMYRPADVRHPASPAAAANGQYLLTTREAYDAIGGHAAVRSSLLEDVELAQLVKRSGRRLWFRYGGDAVRARMYRSFAQLAEGWTKNLALLFPQARWLAALRFAEFAVIAVAASEAVIVLTLGRYRAAGILAAIGGAVWLNLLHRIRRAHFGLAAALVSILGLPVFSYLLLRSSIYYTVRRKIAWKGREYPAVARDERGRV